MPAGFSDAAREIGMDAMTARTFWIELHTDDPGNPDAATPLTRATIANGITAGTNGYYGQWISKTGFVVEGTLTTEARYANATDVDFGTAAGGTWGSISWISIWYDANDEDAANPGTTSSAAFDTLFCVMQLQTAQTVNDEDPFVIRASTIDLISRNAA